MINFYTDLFDPLMVLKVGTITPSRMWIWINCNKGLLHIFQISRIETLPSDAVKCYTQDTDLF